MSLLNKVESMEELACGGRASRASGGGISARRLSPALAVAGAETEALGGRAAALSPREIEVVRMFASGLSITEIARSLDRDVRTISRQKRDAMGKLGVHNDPGLFAFARAHGLT